MKQEILSGSYRGDTLYNMISNGEAVPDIIVNPHAMPSRMTIGHLVETIISKTAAIYGGFGDCTAFQNKGSKISFNHLEFNRDFVIIQLCKNYVNIKHTHFGRISISM